MGLLEYINKHGSTDLNYFLGSIDTDNMSYREIMCKLIEKNAEYRLQREFELLHDNYYENIREV